MADSKDKKTEGAPEETSSAAAPKKTEQKAAEKKAADKPAAEKKAAEPKAEQKSEAKAEKAEPKKAEAKKAEPKAEKKADAKAEQADDAAEQKPAAAAKPAGKKSSSRKKAPAGKKAAEQPAAPAEPTLVRATARFVRSAPRKVRLVVDHIRGESVEDARVFLQFTPRHAGRDVAKVLESAVANAEHNHELDGEDLHVVKAYVDEGPTLKRWRPRAKGRATQILKRTSHITVVVSDVPAKELKKHGKAAA